jgi:hypothetical protein
MNMIDILVIVLNNKLLFKDFLYSEKDIYVRIFFIKSIILFLKGKQIWSTLSSNGQISKRMSNFSNILKTKIIIEFNT